MALNRFATARDVFDAFPTAADDIEAAPADVLPLAFLDDLAKSRTPEDAISFCAYLLPRLEAVWWGCSCVRGMADEAGRAEIEQDPAYRVAEAWVRDPRETRRLEAMRAGLAGSRADACAWLALGAGWSGGDMADNPQAPVLAPPYLTAKAIRAAVLIGLARNPTVARRTKLQICVDHGIRLIGRRRD